MTKSEIFSCNAIKWPDVDRLFEEMSTEGREGVLTSDTTPVDLAVISSHTGSCPRCAEKLVALAEKYGITKGVIFPEEKPAE